MEAGRSIWVLPFSSLKADVLNEYVRTGIHSFATQPCENMAFSTSETSPRFTQKCRRAIFLLLAFLSCIVIATAVALADGCQEFAPLHRNILKKPTGVVRACF